VVSPRTQHLMRGALAAVAVLTAIGATSTSARAEPPPPPPSNASDALKQYQDLGHQAEAINGQLLQADEALNARNGDLARAQGAATQAQAQENQFRGQVDQFTAATYTGASMSQLSAMLTSQSAKDYLDRSSMLDTLSKNDADAIQGLAAATARADDAARQAQQARDDAARLSNDLHQKQAQLKAAADQMHQQYQRLSASDVSTLKSSTHVGLLAGSGAAIQAVNAALSKQGDPYVWGATGPDSFDCSGLTQWAYKQAGVSLPRSTYSQEGVGQSVSQDDLQPGDLLFFYGGGHVGIYIGNGQIVHAPTEGEDVKVEQVKYMGGVSAARRVAG
jgi:peptidoglycan DL-endopeptidase CwlO